MKVKIQYELTEEQKAQGFYKKAGSIYDSNNNSWDLDKYSTNQIIRMSSTLTNCKDCVNCENCVDCIGCKNCVDCENCEECSNCYKCENCLDCGYFDLYSGRCKNLKNCKKCSNCTNCDDCTNCTNCENCIDCDECSYCEGCDGLCNGKSCKKNNPSTLNPEQEAQGLRIENGFLYDKNNNRWNLDNFHLSTALAFAEDLENCTNCEDCISCENCENCVYCRHCKDCQDCTDCYECVECRNCEGCENEYELNNSNEERDDNLRRMR